MINKLVKTKTHSKSMLCKALGVSRSGYYSHCSGGKSSPKKTQLKQQVNRIFHEHRGRYGSPRVKRELVRSGVKCSAKTVAKIMRLGGLRAVKKKSFRPKTTIRKKEDLIAPNLLETKVIDSPNQTWVGDITYIAVRGGGWVYLAAWMDRYSRKIVGWDLQRHMRSDIVEEAFKQGIAKRCPDNGLLIHSDRGSQYACRQFHQSVKSHGFIQSMAACGYCFDNAHMESFWSTLKNEALPQCGYFEDINHARLCLFDYIEAYYNRKRLHSALGFLSPEDFETLHKHSINRSN